jgi:hypothetical protein
MIMKNDPPAPPNPPTPMIYVRDKTVWQYKLVSRDRSGLNEDELNDLGKDGWELAAVLSHGDAAHFYFKRMK